MVRFILLLMIVACRTAVADNTVPDAPPPTGTQLEDLRPGFKALDTLAELKAISDARNAACMKAFGDKRFCVCLNGRLTLDLNFDDYIVLITKTTDDPVYRSLPVEKRDLLNEVTSVRDRCVHDAGER